MTVGKGDPNYAAALAAVRQAAAAVSGTDPATGQPYAEGYAGLPAELAALQGRLVEDAGEAQQVTSWLVTGDPRTEAAQLAAPASSPKAPSGSSAPTSRLAARNRRGCRRASPRSATGSRGSAAGATVLAAGIARLTGGTEALEPEPQRGLQPLLSAAGRPAARLGPDRLDRLVARSAAPTACAAADPGPLRLGLLRALGARRRRRRRCATAPRKASTSNTAARRRRCSSSRATRSTRPARSPSTSASTPTPRRSAAKRASTTGVGGGPATLNDYSRVTRERIPLVVAAITLATFLVLILILRSLPLAAIAVGLNLATVGVAFGILTLLTDVPDGWPLGGHAYVDSVGATMIFGIVFGLSIDYAVFLLVRMREHYDREGDHRAAIMFGLEKTARVITGAAAIMMAVFVVFAGASIATVSQLGVGLTVAVLLDATVVRIVLLPALMLLLGERVWWLPQWLDRALPRLNV